MLLSQALALPQQFPSLPRGRISRPSECREEQAPRHHPPPHISCRPPEPSSSAGSPGHRWQKSREARGKGHDAGSSSRGVTTRTGCLGTCRLCPVREQRHGQVGAASLQPPRKANTRATRRREAKPGEFLWRRFYPESQNFNHAFLAHKAHVPVGWDQATLVGMWGFCPQEGAMGRNPQHCPSSATGAALGKPELTRTSFAVLVLAPYYSLMLSCAQL